MSDDVKTPEDAIPFASVFPGLREGEGPEGAGGGLSRKQVMRILAERTRAARAALGLKDEDCAASFMETIPEGEKSSTPVETPSPVGTQPTGPQPMPGLSGSGSVGSGPVPAEPTLDSMEAAAEIAKQRGTTVRVEMPYGRGPVELTPEQVAERRKFSEGLADYWAKKRAEAREKFGPDVESGWDIPPPSREKLARLLNLHGAGAEYNLCATCKHAVQIVQPVADLGGFGKFHGIHTFCALIRVDGGRNLEIGDEPTQFCSHHARSWSLTAKHKLLALRTNGSGGRVVRALRVLLGSEGEAKEGARK